MGKQNDRAKEVEQMPEETPATPAKPWVLPLLSSLLLSFTVCVFVPLETYYASGNDFWWPVTFLLPTVLLLFLGVFVVTFLIGMLFRGTWRNVVCAGYLGLSLIIYLQGNYLNADYGVFNGLNIDWNSFGYYGRWNLLVWALVILAPIVAVLIKKKLVGAVRFLCVLLTLMQVVSLAALGLTADVPTNARAYAFTTEGEFELSKKDNIVVFVIDTLCPTLMNEYLDSHPQQKELLDGFTQFTNFTGLYRYTDYALPVMLTGHVFDYSYDYRDFWEEAWSESELLNVLKQNNYRTFVYSKTKFGRSSTAEYVENVQEQEMTTRNPWLFAEEYVKLTAFRYLPHGLKKYITDDYTNITDAYKATQKEIYIFDDDVTFLNQVHDQSLTASIEEPTCHFYHLWGAHLPYLLTSDGIKQPFEQPTSITDVLNVYFSMLEDYFNQMKALGVYDDATIIITADHGEPTIDVAPILFVKRPGSTGTLVNDDSLVSQLGFGATIVDAAGIEGTIQTGLSAFDERNATVTQVPFYFYTRTLEFFEYNVSLDSLGDKCYTPTFKVRAPQGVVDDELPKVYEPGTWAGMTTAEFAKEWMDRMSEPLANGYDGVWLGAKPSRVQMRIEQPPTGKLTVRFGITDIVGETQRMQLRDNNGVVAETLIQRGDTEATFTIDAKVMQGDLLSLRLVFPDSLSQTVKTKAVCVNGFSVTKAQ